MKRDSETGVVWSREEKRPRISRKADTGDGATWQKKKKRAKSRDGWTVSTDP